ncbi:MAG: hypothetical protein R3C11_13760 [Planctomycetaceae bacterium]
MRRALLLFSGLTLLFLGGCGDPETTELSPSSSSSDAESPFGSAGVGADVENPFAPTIPEREIDRSRTSFEGRWVLTSTNPNPQQQTLADSEFALVEFTKDASGNFQGKIGETGALPEGSSPPHLENLEVEGDIIKFVIHHDKKKMPCEGKLSNGLVLGTIFAGNRMMFPIRMISTEATTLPEKPEERIRPTTHTEEFFKALKSDNLHEELLKFAEAYPENPYALQGFNTIFNLVVTKDFDEDFLKRAGDKYLEIAELYGNRMLYSAHQAITFSLIETHKHPEMAEQRLNDMEAIFSEQEKEMIKQVLDASRKAIEIDHAIAKLEDNPSDESFSELEALSEARPYEERILYELGAYASQNDKADQAIKYFGKLATIPLMQAKLMQNWKMRQIENTAPASPSRSYGKRNMETSMA